MSSSIQIRWETWLSWKLNKHILVLSSAPQGSEHPSWCEHTAVLAVRTGFSIFTSVFSTLSLFHTMIFVRTICPFLPITYQWHRLMPFVVSVPLRLVASPRSGSVINICYYAAASKLSEYLWQSLLVCKLSKVDTALVTSGKERSLFTFPPPVHLSHTSQ